MTDFEYELLNVMKELLKTVGFINLRLGEIRDELHELNGLSTYEEEDY